MAEVPAVASHTSQAQLCLLERELRVPRKLEHMQQWEVSKGGGGGRGTVCVGLPAELGVLPKR